MLLDQAQEIRLDSLVWEAETILLLLTVGAPIQDNYKQTKRSSLHSSQRKIEVKLER